ARHHLRLFLACHHAWPYLDRLHRPQARAQSLCKSAGGSNPSRIDETPLAPAPVEFLGFAASSIQLGRFLAHFRRVRFLFGVTWVARLRRFSDSPAAEVRD